MDRMFPAECPHLPCECSSPLACLDKVLTITAIALGKFRVCQHLGSISKNDHQHVVEIVRDPSGQSADSFHFLRLAQLLFQSGCLRNITKAPHPAYYCAFDALRL